MFKKLIHAIFRHSDPLGPNQRQWVKALRSGEFQQAREYLHVIERDGQPNVGMCCLGVACILAAVPQVKEQGGFDGKTDERLLVINYGSSAASAPKEVVDWLGLRDSLGRLEGGEPGLATMNDEHGKTFDEIADFVEANPKAVFNARK